MRPAPESFQAGAQDFLQKRAIANFAAADADYGRLLAEKVTCDDWLVGWLIAYSDDS